MPRQSAAAAALGVLSVDGRPARLSPPASLAPDARAVFIDIVASASPEHF